MNQYQAMAKELGKLAGILDPIKRWLPTAHAEHATDLAGLGLMAAGSASHLYSQLKHRDDPVQAEEGGPIKPTAQAGLDLAGLGTMAAPTIAALSSLRHQHAPGHLAGGGGRFTNIANLTGLGSLGAATADKIQARLRAKAGEDPETKQLLGHKAHKALELGGYGALAAPLLRKGRKMDWGDATQLAGYATLAAPHVVPFEGAARSGSELAGLGMLATPVVHGLRGH